MREKKFRYTFKHVASGNVEKKIYTLGQLEKRTVKELSPCFNEEFGYELIGRDDFTGLKDKNGKEIYEGDIVQFAVFDCFDNDKQYKGVVKFAEGQWQIWNSAESEFYGSDGAFDLWWVNQQDDEFEIISNIYENPELLGATS